MKFAKYMVALLILSSSTVHANENVPYEELEIQWPSEQKIMLLDGESLDFISATNRFCGARDAPADIDRSRKFSVQVGAVVVEWIASRLVTAFRDRELRKIAKYSASYSNSPIYDKAFTFSGRDAKDVCVVARRISCTVDGSLVKKGVASCLSAKDRKNEFSIGIVLHPDGENNLRILPYAWSLVHLKPEHARDGKDAVASVRFEIKGLTFDEKAGGKEWKSGQVEVVTFACPFNKDGSAAKPPCAWSMQSDPDWSRAPLLPLPPKTVAAPIFTVAEVGQPGLGLKLFAKFLEDKKDKISDVLADAIKKKLDLGD